MRRKRLALEYLRFESFNLSFDFRLAERLLGPRARSRTVDSRSKCSRMICIVHRDWALGPQP